MRYYNKSDKPRVVVVRMCKRKIQPGEAVDISPHDANHAGASMRFFALLATRTSAEQKEVPISQEVETEATVTEEPVAEEPVAEEPSEEAVEEEPVAEEPVSEEAPTDVEESPKEGSDSAEESAEESPVDAKSEPEDTEPEPDTETTPDEADPGDEDGVESQQ